MPSTTPRQVTSQGSAPSACMAQLARRESAERALFACTVVSEPPCPVLSAWSRSAASAPLTSPTTMWSGRWRSAWRTRSRIDTGASEPMAPASKRTQFARSILSSSVSSIATIRSSSGSSSISAFKSVVFPEPVPPETRMFLRARSTLLASRKTSSGSEPRRTRSSGENARPPNRRMVMATSGAAGGVQMATRDPSPSRASRMGLAAGSSPSGRAMWIAARWSQAAVSPGASWGSSRPPRSTQTLPGPLIMISETSRSSRSISKPGRNGVRWPIPLARFISVPPRGAASSRSRAAGSGA